jgi:ribosomal protein S18 acetylase RimI-like enzyme
MIPHIRPIELPDLPAVFEHIKQLAISNAALEHFKMTPERMHNDIFGQQSDWHGLVATKDDAVIGSCLYSVANTNRAFHATPLLFVDSLYIDPAYQSQGLGTRVMKTLASNAATLMLSRIELFCLKKNHDANGFYRALGAQELDYVNTYSFTCTSSLPRDQQHAIRPIAQQDLPHVFEQIQTLAKQEGMSHRLRITLEELHANLFGSNADLYGIVSIKNNGVTDHVIGFCLYSRSHTSRIYNPTSLLYVDGLYVHPDHHGTGVGHELMKELNNIAYQASIFEIELWCIKTNDRANAFYKKSGGQLLDFINIYRLEVGALS